MPATHNLKKSHCELSYESRAVKTKPIGYMHVVKRFSS